jgi:hypothetical protein
MPLRLMPHDQDHARACQASLILRVDGRSNKRSNNTDKAMLENCMSHRGVAFNNECKIAMTAQPLIGVFLFSKIPDLI